MRLATMCHLILVPPPALTLLPSSLAQLLSQRVHTAANRHHLSSITVAISGHAHDPVLTDLPSLV